MMVTHPAAQRRLKFGLRGLDSPMGQGRQCKRIGLTGDQGERLW
jgi:hypothetical protein